jgi:antitoxin VapB
MTQLTTSDLPEALQKLFLEVEQTNTPLTIIHEGKPLVVIYPAKNRKSRPPFGFMKGQGEILGDIIAPVEQPWEVLQ